MVINKTYLNLLLGCLLFGLATLSVHGQFLLQAPSDGDESNYRWYEATDTATVLGTESYLEVTEPGVYFATYDGTLCGSNATGYFIVTNCNNPYNQVTLDIRQNIKGSPSIAWDPPISGDQQRPTVTADMDVTRYVASLTKAGNTFELPAFTVVCMDQSANLVDDTIAVDEDSFVVVPVFDNDSDLPEVGSLTVSDPAFGTISVDNSGTPNDPTDDVITYTPEAEYNGPDSFTYTICNTYGDCSTATVDIAVIPVLDAIDDTLATEENTPLEIHHFNNDNDLPVDGTHTFTQPENGTLTLNDNDTPFYHFDDNFVYTPNPGFLGNDTFEYTICDVLGHCSTATVTIVVTEKGLDLDADNDGIVDTFEDLNIDGDGNPATNPTDTDEDGVPDYLDIDSDNDGIPDNVESQYTYAYIPPSGEDANDNGLDDAYEVDGVGIFPVDTDGDELPDYLDSDSDNDTVPDYVEGHDYDHDGLADVVFIGSDKDNDGLDDGYEGSQVLDRDVNDEIDDPLYDLPNTDGDGESDYRDVDDDGDGKLTTKEDVNGDGNFTNDDEDGDGIPDYLEPNAPALEVFNVVTPNGDGMHDYLAIRGIEQYPENSIRIYNRWGVMVYSTNAYDSAGNVFDGTSEGRATVQQDNKLPVGTYFYVLDYKVPDGSTKTLSGYLYLNR